MARYDRIAPLNPPTRDTAFPGWPVLRDIEGKDRDADFARRARLRFLALRPVRRLLDRGTTPIGRESYLSQIEGVREELGYLPTRDVERARLARFLHQIEDRELARLTAAALEMADACAAAGHMYGAEEYALTALGLSERQQDARLQSASYTCLARIARMRAEWEMASDYSVKAERAAESKEDVVGLVRAQGERALAAATRAEADAARATMTEMLRTAREKHDANAEAVAIALACTCENLLGNAAAALEHGWNALRQIDDARERGLLLEQVGRACAMLGLHSAAERCLSLVAQRGVDPALRARARALQAVEAAELSGAQLFRERRVALLNDAADWSADPRVAAFVHLELGRGSLLVGGIDDAREHLRAAIEAARRHSLPDIIASAEQVLSALEQNAVHVNKGGSMPAADDARRIAEQVVALPDLQVAVL